MERIIFWLESKDSDYFEGLRLYESLPTHNKNLVRNLKRTESAFNRQKLIYELKKVVNVPIQKKELPIYTTSPVVEITISPSPVLTSVQDHEKKIAPLFHQLPAQVRPILLEANNLFKENCLFKTELNELHADQEAEALAIQIQIDRNEKANTLAWSKIDYYLEHKRLPPTSKVSLSKWSIDKLMYKRNLIEASLSKQRKRLTTNKEKLSILEGTELHKLQRTVAKQEKAVLEKEEQLFKIKEELNGKK